MSEDDYTNECNRRDLLKVSASTGMASLGFAAATGMSAADDSDERSLDDDFEVLATEELPEREAAKNVRSLRRSEAGREFLETVKNNHDLKEVGVTAVRGVTTNEAIEEMDPVVVLMGLDPEENADQSAGGLMYSVVGEVESNGRGRGSTSREPLVVRGLIGRSEDGDSAGHDHPDEMEVAEYAPDDSEGATIVDTHTVELPSTSGEVSAQSFHGTIGTPVCVGAVATLCEYGGGSVTRTQCVPACTAVGPSGPIGYTACLAFCAYAVDVIQSRGCSIGASALCALIFENV